MKYNILFFFILFSLSLKAQYRPQHSLYMLNNYLLNPAITGIENYTDIQTGYRQQWTNIEGMPRTLYLSIHTPIGLKSSKPHNPVHNAPEDPYIKYSNRNRKLHHGLGGSAFVDEIGPFLRKELNVSYGVHIPVANAVTLSAGTSGGIVRQSLDINKVITTHPQDPLISNGQSITWQPIITVGLIAHGANWYAGLSGLQYLKYTGQLQKSSKLSRHIYATLSFQYKLGLNAIAQPIFLLRWDRRSGVYYDIGTRFIFLNIFWAGGVYRSIEEVVLQAGYHINSFLSLGYSYDIGMSALSSRQTGSHELVLICRLWKKNTEIPCPFPSIFHFERSKR